MNYTIRPVLWTGHKAKDGLYSLKLCITVGRDRTYIKTPYRLKENQFKNGQAVKAYNAEVINAFVREEILKYDRKMFNQSPDKEVTLQDVVKVEKRSIKLEDYAKIIRYDKTRVNRMLAYHPDLRMASITLDWLRAFEQHELNRGSHHNTIHSTFKYLGQLLRAATREEIIKKDPMLLFKRPKYVKPTKDYLIDKEIKKLWKLLEKPLPENTRATLVYFLLACYSGLRHSDWPTFDAKTMYTPGAPGLLRLRAYKNDADVVVPVGPSLEKLIKMTRELPTALSNQKCNVHLKAIGVMAGLDKKITCHTARHTAGNLFASKGMNVSVVAQLLAITESTAQVYFHLSGADITKQAAVLSTI